MTAAEPSRGESTTTQRSVLRDGLDGVRRTGWVEPAARSAHSSGPPVDRDQAEEHQGHG